MTMDELRDIKPIVPLSWSPPWWAWVIAAVVAVAAGAFVLWRRRKGRLPAPRQLSPRARALLALEAVHSNALLVRADDVRLYDHLAAVLRVWAEGQFGFGATAMTTEELAASPVVKSSLGEASTALLRLLRSFDDPRFARTMYDLREHAGLIEEARSLVLRFPEREAA